MADTGQGLRAEQLLHQLNSRDAQLVQLQERLAYFQGWCSKLATAQYSRSLSAPVMLAAVQVLISGIPEGTVEHELAAFFCEVMAANAAAVSPGPVVVSCRKLRHQHDSALLQLRCTVEASNCLAFDGIHFKGAALKVQRPKEYNPDTAVLLGPQQPDPAVLAALANNSPDLQCTPVGATQEQQQQHRAGSYTDQQHDHFASACHKAATAPGSSGTCSFTNAAKTTSSSNWRVSSSSRIAAMAQSAPGGNSSVSGRHAYRDLAPSADQSKQDEVFIGGLPSHWKAQQVKELLAPYGQLKSLSVAMDAATGKNKGYAFVVFASSAVVPRAIEELDCKVVDGKILAVQRATDGKAAACSAGSYSIQQRDGTLAGSSSGGGNAGLPCRENSSNSQDLQQQQQQQQQQRRPQRSSSGSSSNGGGSSGPLPGPQLAATATVTITAAADGCGADACSVAGNDAVTTCQKQQQHAVLSGSQDASQPTAAAAAAATAPDGSTLGQRLLAAMSAGGGGGVAVGPGSKQYDVNELYIGDLPLSWDEDAVRRLLGRYGKIKYFTLRNGRDKNFAFCKFKDSGVVDAAIAGLHGKIVDGYFLNVRRAVEGKQQQQQQWPSNKQLNRTSYEASKFVQMRVSDQQQLRSSRGNMLDRRSAPPAAAVHGQQQDEPQPQQQVKAANAPDGIACLESSKQMRQPQQQQQDDMSTVSPPSPPGTPTVAQAHQQQQQQHASVVSAAGPGVQQLVSQFQQLQQQQQQPLSSFKHEQQQWQQPQQQHVFGPPPRQPQQQQQQQQSLFQSLVPPPYQQQQQQQQQPGPSLFLSGPASAPAGSWGFPAAVLHSASGSSSSTGDLLSTLCAPAPLQQQQQQQQTQQHPQSHSLLQTWDMLSPWSLFSHAQKTPW